MKTESHIVGYKCTIILAGDIFKEKENFLTVGEVISIMMMKLKRYIKDTKLIKILSYLCVNLSKHKVVPKGMDFTQNQNH